MTGLGVCKKEGKKKTEKEKKEEKKEGIIIIRERIHERQMFFLQRFSFFLAPFFLFLLHVPLPVVRKFARSTSETPAPTDPVFPFSFLPLLLPSPPPVLSSCSWPAPQSLLSSARKKRLKHDLKEIRGYFAQWNGL